VSDLVKKRCDILASIPMRGKISSLNASIAAAVVMYEAYRQRTGDFKVQR
jgi:23S rRNA (guanosine2251-2'-O)-methyltransferase